MKYQTLLSLLVLFLTRSVLIAQDVPRLEWVSQMGGTGFNTGEDIFVDGSGNIYTTGLFWGTVDFDPGPGTFNLTSAGTSDIFITKQNSAGTLIWAVRMGGTGNDDGFSITVDLNGNVLTTGHFRNTVDFDPGPGVFNLSGGFYEAFISKLDAFGNFVWAVKFGEGSNDQNGYSIAVDAVGNVYTTGSYINTVDFDPGAGVFNLNSGCNDAYVSKLSPNGDFIWAKRLGGTGCSEEGNAIVVDATGNVFVAGQFNGTADFDPNAGTFNMTSAGSYDIFICNLDTNGNFVWAKQLGGTLTDQVSSMVMDASGNLLITGQFSGTSDFDPGVGMFTLSSAGGTDIYISKLTNSGDFVWAKNMGGSQNDFSHDIMVDPLGNAYITGEFRDNADFDPGTGTFILSGGTVDGFVSKLDNSGNFAWAIEIGGSGFDYGYGITVDASENVYTTGSFYSSNTDFDPTPCPALLATLGSGDIFVQKLSKATPLPPLHTITGFTPTIGPIGTTVTLSGTNFSATPADNIVTFFNNVPAIVTASTPTSITTTVPVGTATGRISVTLNCITLQTATNFTIGASTLPTITSFTPTSGLIGTTVTITGTNFSTTPANNTVQFNGTTAIVTASSITSITTSVPGGATTGKITVTIGGNTATSATDFTVTTPVIFITQQPVTPNYACENASASFTTAATGTTNITYQWQKFDGSVFVNLADNATYTGATTATLTINNVSSAEAGDYQCVISDDLAASVTTNTANLVFNSLPTPPDVVNGISCGPGVVTLTASGGSPGDYQWYTTSPLTLISGATDETFITPLLNANTDYAVTLRDTFCESIPVTVAAIISTPPAKPAISSSITPVGNELTICSTTSLTLSAPTAFASYLWSDGSSLPDITVTASGTYSVTVLNGNGCASPDSDGLIITVVPGPCNNSAPVISAPALSTIIGQGISVNLQDLVSDADGNLVLSSLAIIQQPTSGANAYWYGAVLVVEYTGLSFTGIDVITIQVCDVFGECATQQLSITVIGEIEIFNAVSPNADGKNDFFNIQYIDLIEPENTVTIYNRWGSKVFETENYSEANSFRGLNQNGNELPSGTYFYKIFLSSSGETKTGYLSLRR